MTAFHLNRLILILYLSSVIQKYTKQLSRLGENGAVGMHDSNLSTIQSIEHIINDCSLRKFNGYLKSMHLATADAVDWSKDLNLN